MRVATPPVLRLSAAAVVLLVLSVSPARAQRVGTDPNDRERRPFAFTLNRYPESFDRNPLEEWLEAVQQHRAGDGDGAAVRIGRWTQNHLAYAVSAFHATPTVSLPREKLDLTRRGAILHTDIALLACRAAADRLTTQADASLHFGVAYNLVEYLRRAYPDDPFVLAWYRTVAAFLLSFGEITSAPILLDRAVAVFPSNVELLTSAGAVHERLASPRVQEASDVDGDLRRDIGSPDANLEQAEEFYRRALKADARDVEARLHLGRVLMLRQRYDAAASELRAVAGERCVDSLRFLANLFLGQTEAARGRREPARQAYEQALALFPAASSAHLALSHLERSSADRRRAVSALRDWFERTKDDAADESDPWNDYFLVWPAHYALTVLDELHQPFRRQP